MLNFEFKFRQFYAEACIQIIFRTLEVEGKNMAYYGLFLAEKVDLAFWNFGFLGFLEGFLEIKVNKIKNKRKVNAFSKRVSGC